jgi:CheY-like chemotaxis protein
LHGGAKNTATLEGALKNKLVLVVDDDMRNIFALTSALQAYDLKIEIANNGVEALKKLEEKPETHLVLMDIMMPEMDGYEAMAEIRKQNRFKKLPIIALTAKAMKDDREKCIEAGANDYISKPVDIDKLLSLMRVWLS